jgi:hypothetical protein
MARLQPGVSAASFCNLMSPDDESKPCMSMDYYIGTLICLILEGDRHGDISYIFCNGEPIFFKIFSKPIALCSQELTLTWVTL